MSGQSARCCNGSFCLLCSGCLLADDTKSAAVNLTDRRCEAHQGRTHSDLCQIGKKNPSIFISYIFPPCAQHHVSLWVMAVVLYTRGFLAWNNDVRSAGELLISQPHCWTHVLVSCRIQLDLVGAKSLISPAALKRPKPLLTVKLARLPPVFLIIARVQTKSLWRAGLKPCDFF